MAFFLLFRKWEAIKKKTKEEKSKWTYESRADTIGSRNWSPFDAKNACGMLIPIQLTQQLKFGGGKITKKERKKVVSILLLHFVANCKTPIMPLIHFE